MKVGFQGEAGAYSELAACRVGAPYSFKNFAGVFKAIEQRNIDCGALPAENSLAGTIHEVYDLLMRHQVEIIADTYVRIEHCLVGLPGSTVENAKQVFSHPQALMQCDKFFYEHPHLEAVSNYDTAGSAKMLRESGSMERLAIASAGAAEIYGLEILQRNIATYNDNYTRFFIIAPKGAKKESYGVPLVTQKTSLVFNLLHETGSLFHALSAFALRRINLTKIESRPLRGRAFEYLFYIDYLEPEKPELSARTMAHLKEVVSSVTILGHYGCIGETPSGPIM